MFSGQEDQLAAAAQRFQERHAAFAALHADVLKDYVDPCPSSDEDEPHGPMGPDVAYVSGRIAAIRAQFEAAKARAGPAVTTPDNEYLNLTGKRLVPDDTTTVGAKEFRACDLPRGSTIQRAGGVSTLEEWLPSGVSSPVTVTVDGNNICINVSPLPQ